MIWLLFLPLAAWAQDPANDPAVIDVGEIETGRIQASINTQKNARIIELKVPSPRGQIVDRHGRPLAQTKMAHYPAIRFPVDREMTPDEAVVFAKDVVSRVNNLLGAAYELPDADILKHFENRRYLPLTFGDILNSRSEEIVRKKIGEGLDMHALYLRHYPNGALAPHVIGYVRRTSGPPSGPIENGDLVFDVFTGVDGLERSFDEVLTGKDGSLQVLFNNEGKKVSEKITRKPVQGNNVVTTLDRDIQRWAESAVRGSGHPGAMAVVDVNKGDILALASYPMFDPNDFVPKISQQKWDKIKNNKSDPLIARAFQGHYCPASTFKVFMSVGMLKSGRVSPYKTFRCPPFLRSGGRRIHNWSKSDMGRMSLRQAIKMSCNTYFFQIGDIVGSDDLIAEALHFGFGKPTGIPLKEYGGFIPTNAWMIESERGRDMTQGDIWNFVIGQGFTEVTPLQVAQGFAGIANGKVIPRVHLIKQIQDTSNQVIESFAPPPLNSIDLKEEALGIIRSGMVDCVNDGNGTGRWASSSYVTVAGKTGTGEWIQGRDLAWLAGFVPASNPRFAFACVYEGYPGQGLSGGRNAGPIARRFINSLYGNKGAMIWQEGKPPTSASDKEKSDKKKASRSSRRRSRARSNSRRSTPRARPAPRAQPAPKQPQKRRSWISRIFRR